MFNNLQHDAVKTKIQTDTKQEIKDLWYEEYKKTQ